MAVSGDERGGRPHAAKLVARRQRGHELAHITAATVRWFGRQHGWPTRCPRPAATTIVAASGYRTARESVSRLSETAAAKPDPRPAAPAAPTRPLGRRYPLRLNGKSPRRHHGKSLGTSREMPRPSVRAAESAGPSHVAAAAGPARSAGGADKRRRFISGVYVCTHFLAALLPRRLVTVRKPEGSPTASG